MLYTDGVHIVADTLREMHASCQNQLGISRSWYEGIKKGHPHYDAPKKWRLLLSGIKPGTHKILLNRGGRHKNSETITIIKVRPREVLQISKKLYEEWRLQRA